MQAWNSDANASGSRIWPKEEIEQSIDLRIDGIPNDETYTDEQYMQRIAEQVQKLVTKKENLKETQTFEQLVADAYMTFQGTRGARYGAQPWQKHHFLAREFMRKDPQKGMCTSILDRFQNGEVFRASQLQHNWTKECCE